MRSMRVVARGNIGRNHQHRDQGAQRPGSWIASRGDGRPARMRLIDARVRSRCACHNASATGSCVASVSVSAVAGRWRIAGAAIQPVESRFAVRPAKPEQRKHRPQRQNTNTPARWRAPRTAEPATIGPGHRPETVRRQSTGAPNAARPSPRRSHISPAAGLRQLQSRNGVSGARGF